MQVSAFHIDWTEIKQIVQGQACAEDSHRISAKAHSNGFDFHAEALYRRIEAGLKQSATPTPERNHYRLSGK